MDRMDIFDGQNGHKVQTHLSSELYMDLLEFPGHKILLQIVFSRSVPLGILRKHTEVIGETENYW